MFSVSRSKEMPNNKTVDPRFLRRYRRSTLDLAYAVEKELELIGAHRVKHPPDALARLYTFLVRCVQYTFISHLINLNYL